MQKNNYCVIGGAGFILSHVTDELLRNKNNQVLVLDNLSSGNKKNINRRAKFIKYDIRSPHEKLSKILKEYGIKYVFHGAAEPYIPECYEKPKEFFEVNASGTMNVLLACKEANVSRIVYYSTSEVYGTVMNDFISEDYPTNPQSTYAVSKLAGDRLCFTLFKEHKIPVIILRQFNCYGPRETHDYIIPEIITQLSKGNNLCLGNINSQRDFIYVEDAARIAVKLIRAGRVGEVYNLGTGRVWSMVEIAQKIGEVMGIMPRITVDKKRLRPHDVNYLRADNKKILHITRIKAETDEGEGLLNTVKYFYENDGWSF
jgi:nucleoside-diphosphate-sugar epimerase